MPVRLCGVVTGNAGHSRHTVNIAKCMQERGHGAKQARDHLACPSFWHHTASRAVGILVAWQDLEAGREEKRARRSLRELRPLDAPHSERRREREREREPHRSRHEDGGRHHGERDRAGDWCDAGLALTMRELLVSAASCTVMVGLLFSLPSGARAYLGRACTADVCHPVVRCHELVCSCSARQECSFSTASFPLPGCNKQWGPHCA